MKSLSDYDIYQILKKNNLIINGIYTKDKLPSKLKNGFYIINMQDSTDGNGTHWTILLKNNNTIIYYDSFGVVGPETLTKRFKKYYYSLLQCQNVASSSCGFFIIFFIYFMYNNRTLEQYNKFINIFHDTPINNEKKLKSIFNDIIRL
jgi:hypothetical protein